jgi:hypothetical protein
MGARKDCATVVVLDVAVKKKIVPTSFEARFVFVPVGSQSVAAAMSHG